ncbi:hypothetical protein [Candidatus Williamhamiltonella defendens]|uniref:hypothetical protein n=1 Tax=Candidatus Williamhamiltonella defendens TaxID=138072 RepID=UPI0018737CB5|nr:hypothetical protein [Candidatus Hamiltonella defensa]
MRVLSRKRLSRLADIKYTGKAYLTRSEAYIAGQVDVLLEGLNIQKKTMIIWN